MVYPVAFARFPKSLHAVIGEAGFGVQRINLRQYWPRYTLRQMLNAVLERFFLDGISVARLPRSAAANERDGGKNVQKEFLATVLAGCQICTLANRSGHNSGNAVAGSMRLSFQAAPAKRIRCQISSPTGSSWSVNAAI